MPIPIIHDQQAHRGRGILPAVLLSVVATLAVIVPVAIFFRPDNIDPQVSATSQHIRAGEQQTTSGIDAIYDRPAAEKFLAQTRGTKAINNSLAAEDQFIALSARLSTLQDATTRMQDAMTRILRDNADLAQQLRATQTQQTQMAQDIALVAEQLKAPRQMMAAKMQDLDRNDLRYVLSLSRTGRIAAAARKLGVDGSRVRRRIARIESRLGVRLFERNAGILTPTDSGKIVVRRAESNDLDVDALKDSVTSAPEP